MIEKDLFSSDPYMCNRYKMEDLLSWKDGVNIIIVFTNGLILEYDKILNPNNHIKESLYKYEICNNDEESLDNIKRCISEINIKRIGLDDYYIEVWNNQSSDNLPYNNSLIRFNNPIYHQYADFFYKNKSFTRTYLSMHYNFKYSFIKEYWQYLDLGNAHYTDYINDSSEIFYSKFGLSYNKNIRWNSKLRAKYDYGLFNPFIGEYIGIEGIISTIEDIDYMDIMIPLKPDEEINRREHAIFDYYNDVFPEKMEDPDFNPFPFCNIDIFQKYDYLDFKEFEKIFNESKLKVLVNDTIWDKTLKYILDQDFVYAFFNMIKSE